MAVCTYCDQEMLDHVGCTQEIYDDFPDELPRKRIPYYGASDCHDCGAPSSTLHHPGCDTEKCPLCEGQAISCGCTQEEEEYDDA